MSDPRFYEAGEPISLGELEHLTGAKAGEGANRDRRFSGVAGLTDANGGDVTFCAGDTFTHALKTAGAGVCFVPQRLALAVPTGCEALVTPHPQYGYGIAAAHLVRPREHNADHDVSPDAILEPDVVIGRGAVVGRGAQVGEGTIIGPGAVIGPGVAIGRQCRIGSGARIGFALVGDRVHIHANAVVGEPGFGAALGPRGMVSLPQLGRVILQDDVRVGANSCIDRGALNDTVIGMRTKLDNLVHIGHNCIVGADCVMAAYTGLSGSCIVGDGCQFGGRSGVVDHITIGSAARIGADAAVMKNVPAGETWAGSPARPIKAWLRQTAWLSRQSRRS